MSDERSKPTARTKVRRVPNRGHYDLDVVKQVIDAALIAHVGFVGDGNQPYVIPMAVARDGDRLLLHGSTASRLMRTVAGGTDVCVTVTHLDGIVVSRSVFDSSMNYRSAVVLGSATPITDRDEKLAALRTIVNHLLPGRWDEARHPNEQELKATLVLALPLSESSAKIRTGPPADDEADLDQPVLGRRDTAANGCVRTGSRPSSGPNDPTPDFGDRFRRGASDDDLVQASV